MTKNSPLPEPFVSVVVCVFNEAENIRPLLLEIDAAMRGSVYEIVYVNDGSTDGTLKELVSLTHPHLVVVDLQRNYGQSQALAAGIEIARGQYIVTLDGDLQNDPADIPMLLSVAKKGGYDLVGTVRLKRKDSLTTRKIPSYVANWLIRTLSKVPLKDYGSTLKVFRADLAKKLPLYGELHRFIPILAAMEGAKMTDVLVKHRPRMAGVSHYSMNRTVKVISDLVLVLFLKKYLIKPMHFFGLIATWMMTVSFLIGGYVGLKMWVHGEASLRGFSFLAIFLFVAGIHFLGLGILAELMTRTLHESQDKKPYSIRQVHYAKDRQRTT